LTAPEFAADGADPQFISRHGTVNVSYVTQPAAVQSHTIRVNEVPVLNQYEIHGYLTSGTNCRIVLQQHRSVLDAYRMCGYAVRASQHQLNRVVLRRRHFMASVSEATKATSSGAQSSSNAPLIVDLGRHKSKSVKRLRNGKGKLIGDVMNAIEDLRTAGTISASAQPVIIVVREKRSRKGLLPMMGL
jgi:hypothetical protein